MAKENHWGLRELTMQRPSLEDVFVYLTRSQEEEEEEEEE